MFNLAGEMFLLLSFISIYNMINTTLAQPDFLFSRCENAANYTVNSTYGRNLNTTLWFLSDLPYHSFGSGFYRLSTGQGTDRVNSIALCRGDANPDVCQGCLNDSIVKLRQLCPNQIEAIGWYDNCMLTYSDQMILGNPRTNYVYLVDNQNSSDIIQLNGALEPLLNQLKDDAAAGSSLLKYASGYITGPDFITIYGLMQCIPDISKEQCDDCLGDIISRIVDWQEGKVGGRILLPMCNIRYESYRFFNQSTSQIILPPPTSQESPSIPQLYPSIQAENNNTKRYEVIIVLGVVMVVIVTTLCITMILRRKKKKQQTTPPPAPKSIQNALDIGTLESLQFDFSTVKVATNSFSEENKLGRGGFGAVYKGTLGDGHQIAVKRLALNSEQGELEFKNEVLLMAKLQHRNLVRLLGFSIEGSERLLIYEFMQNGSLDKFIFDPTKHTLLDWEKRQNIIKGIAKGLQYLHEDSRLRIVHRDMKAGNVLLDEQMNPKVADFGMARLFKTEETEGDTSRIVGTYGYMAPEYAMHGQFSVKSDVFSYGMLVLEMVTGQKNQCFKHGESREDLLSFAWNSWRNGTLSDIIDPTLMAESGSLRDIIRSIHIGLLCVQEKVVDRPTMASVVHMLNSFSMTLPEPAEPAFFMRTNIDPEMPLLRRYNSSTESRGQGSSQYSVNEVSISDFVPR